MNKQKNSSVFVHIIILFLTLMVFIYAIGLVIFNVNRKFMIEQTNKSLNKQITTYFESLKGEIDRIKKMHIQLLVDEDLNLLRIKEIYDIDYDMTKSINRLIKQLNNVKDMSSNIESVSVSIPKLQRTYNSQGDIPLPSYFEHINNVNSMVSQVNSNGVTYFDGEIHIFTAENIEGNSIIAPVFFNTKISKEKIQNSIETFHITDESISIIIFDQMDNFILSSNEDDVKKLTALNLQPSTIINEDIFDENYIIISYYIDFFEATYIQAIPKKVITKDIDKLKLWYYVFSFAVLLALGIYTLYAYNLIKKPIDILVKSFQEIQNENFKINIEHETNNEFSIVYHSFNLMVKKLNKLINEIYLQKILNHKSELRQLQAQINPHFLYNSFFILKKRIFRKQFEDAEEFCEMLEYYFYYITKNYEDYSTLEDEINHARVYANIQGIRFRNRIKIKFDKLPEKLNRFIVPKLILQPIIENAFKYGLEDKEFDGLLKVSFNTNSEYVFIVVEDNGERLLKDENTLKTIRKKFKNPNDINEISGLLNIHKRIRLFTGEEKSGLVFSKSNLGGLRVDVKINLNKKLVFE